MDSYEINLNEENVENAENTENIELEDGEIDIIPIHEAIIIDPIDASETELNMLDNRRKIIALEKRVAKIESILKREINNISLHMKVHLVLFLFLFIYVLINSYY